MEFLAIKGPNGHFEVADPMYLPDLTKFKNGEVYEIDVKLSRNPSFHRKVFAFFKFCFDHWCATRTELEFMDESDQFNTFRKNLTVLAGYKKVTWTIDGRMRVEPESLSFGNMDQAQFEKCYSALINAAIKHIFGGTKNQNTINQLYSYF